MTIHREGYPTILLSALVLGILNAVVCYFAGASLPWLCWILLLVSIGLWLFLISFFRIPNRLITTEEGAILCPADGKVVVIEEMVDEEYFKGKRLQVSIFMSPLNVHVNRHAIDGTVTYSKYHKGKFLVAWHPKSSTENERHSIVVVKDGKEILIKQIAGALAKRIVNYCKPGDKAIRGDELGFIKFGSRVDVLLPVGTKVAVELNQHVKGGVTVLATW